MVYRQNWRKYESMNRLLVIDADRAASEAFVLGAGVGTSPFAPPKPCARRPLRPRGARLGDPGDARLIRLSPAAQADVFEMVAPGVPVVVVLKPNSPIEEHVRFELAGFRVLSRPVDPGDLLAKLEVAEPPAPARRGAAERVRTLCG
jgi:hypothetical protein